MKVLFISDLYSLGGATKALCEIVVELRNLGIESIVCNSVRDQLNEYLDSIGVKNISDGHLGAMGVPDLIAWNGSKIKLYAKECKRYWKKRAQALKEIEKQIDLKEIDIVHTNSARNDIGCLIHQKYGIPHVMHLREFGQEDFNCWVYKWRYYQYISRQSNRILAVSNAVLKAWVKKGVDSRVARTLYDGIDIKKILCKKENTFSTKSLKLVMVGGVCDTKGQHIAIEALYHLPEEIRKEVSLDFVGWVDSLYLMYLQNRIRSYGLEKKVRFLGTRDDVGSLLKDYDIGLMCSKCEGFGRVTAEYMYVGLGVIAANTGASPELVTDGSTGLIYDREDALDLSKKILQFWNHRELLSEYGKRAHEEAEQRFSAERNAQEILEVYQSILR